MIAVVYHTADNNYREVSMIYRGRSTGLEAVGTLLLKIILRPNPSR